MKTLLGIWVLVGVAALSGCGGSPSNPQVPVPDPSDNPAVPGSILVLSNRADLVSGDDVLVEVVLPAGIAANTVVLKVNGAIASGAFGVDADGRYLARVTGLALGPNTLSAQLPDAAPVSVEIVNFPNGGPVFSGPQVQPWVCQDTAVDAQCNQPAEYTFLYKSTNPEATGLQPYDPDNPPTDVAMTTPDTGTPLPFIVRQERGYQARDEYKILTLFQPGQPWQPWAPQPQWNHKMLVTHGGSCGTDHTTGGAPLEDYAGTIPANPAYEQSYIVALGRGFTVMSTALDNLGHSCSVVIAAESLMMAKERVVEQYGELRFTLGTGCSGGSITQQHVANAYPGIYNGLITTCAYPDALSTGSQFADLHLLRPYFEDPSKWAVGVTWTEQNMADVEGHVSHANAVASDEAFFKAVTIPSTPCSGVSDEERYDASTNPGGVRCGLIDYMINVLGPRAPSVWSPMEIAAGRGFGGIFADNKGIQYGLNALREGLITPAQFVDVNVKIGGVDIDFNAIPERLVADHPSLENGFRSGGVNVTNNLKYVGIINTTGPDPGIAHDVVHAWWTRWRLDREQGHHDNHAMWGGPAPLIGDPGYMLQALEAMDRWMSAVAADTSNLPLPQKIIARKPADVHDQCSNGQGTKLTDETCPDEISGRFETPRFVAGDVNTADTQKCQLRPLDRADNYGPLGALTFTDDQWAQLETLFADGVCDYTKPGVGFQPTLAWLTYQDESGSVIYGGTPLPPPPAASALGWAAPAFRGGT